MVESSVRAALDEMGRESADALDNTHPELPFPSAARPTPQPAVRKRPNGSYRTAAGTAGLGRVVRSTAAEKPFHRRRGVQQSLEGAHHNRAVIRPVRRLARLDEPSGRHATHHVGADRPRALARPCAEVSLVVRRSHPRSDLRHIARQPHRTAAAAAGLGLMMIGARHPDLGGALLFSG
jgi:hypothetical protein